MNSIWETNKSCCEGLRFKAANLVVAVAFGILGCGPETQNKTRVAEPPKSSLRLNAPADSLADSPAEAKRDHVSKIVPVDGFAFDNIAEAVGLTFRHDSPLSPERHLHLVMGSGLGWIDFDRDGAVDLFCCQGSAYSGTTGSTSPQSDNSRDALYRNVGDRFVDVGDLVGIRKSGYSMGVTASDFDNDGFSDLFVSGFGENRLYQNCGDGSFVQVALPDAVKPGRMSASCAWADIDNDGDVDLFVTNYAQLGPENYPLCDQEYGGKKITIACHPSLLERVPDQLYRNLGDGQFAEVSKEIGISDQPRQGLGVIAADLDFDGDIDFYVANDTSPNQLWENDGSGHFRDRGVESSTATNRRGQVGAGMGIAVGDVDGSGTFDLCITNYYNETNTLHRNDGQMLFSDITDEFGLGAPSRLRLGFGISTADFNNDGWLDYFVANGHVHDRLHELQREGPFAQLAQLFENQQGRRFRDLGPAPGPYFQWPHVGRGSAIADLDRDGDSDIAVSHLNGPIAMLKNTLASENSWIQCELIGVQSNRSVEGGIVRFVAGNHTFLRGKFAGNSYLSCDEVAIHCGLGVAKEADVIVTWPGGKQETWRSLSTGRRHYLVEGDSEGLNNGNRAP